MFVKLLVLSVVLAAAHGVEFIIRNREIGPIWVGIQGNPGKEHLRGGGFNLDAGEVVSIWAADDWAGRFWARTWCSWDNFHCETGDCGFRLECGGNGGTPPASLAEITLRGWGGLDYYDISLVDGFNIRLSMEPIGGSGTGGEYSCRKTYCHYLLNDECPPELRLYGSAGWAIGCKSACLAFDTDQYCCRGIHGVPENCRATDWPVNWPAFFKQRCPLAYSYAYDDTTSTFTCTANAYEIVFGV